MVKKIRLLVALALLFIAVGIVVFPGGSRTGTASPEPNPIAQQAPTGQDPCKSAYVTSSVIEQRACWFYGQRAFPGTQIPPDALVRARRTLQSAPLAPAAAAAPWTAIGPAPIANGQIYPALPVSGRILAILVKPTDYNVIYVGTAEGGVWRTTNGGTTWEPLTDTESSLAIGALAMDWTNNIIYAGTGENTANSGPDGYYGAGILKSSLGGDSGSWTLMAADTFKGCRIGKIVIDPTSPSTLYAASIGSPGNVPPGTVAGCGGIYKSANGGSGWTKLAGGLPVTGVASDLVMDPSNHLNLYAGIAGDGVWRSIDGGDVWTRPISFPTQSALASIVLAVSPSLSSTVYASLGNGDGSLNSIWKSTNFGTNGSWTNLGNASHYCDWYPPFLTGTLSAVAVDSPTAGTTTLTSAAFQTSYSLNGYAIDMTSGLAANQARTISGHNATAGTIQVSNFSSSPAAGNSFKIFFKPTNQCWYNNVLIVDPSDPNTVYAGGIDIFRSTDGAATFTDLIGTWPGKIHPDQHAFAFDIYSLGPPVIRRLLVGNDGGIWRSPAATNPAPANLNGNLAITQFYPGIAGQVAAPTLLVGGTQDNSTDSYTGSLSWHQFTLFNTSGSELTDCGGDGGYAAVDRLHTNTIYCTSANLDIRKTTNGGSSFFTVNGGIVTTEKRLFIAPLVMDPSNEATLYAGTDHLYKTTDGAGTTGDWTPISPDLAVCGTATGCGISAIAPARSNSNVIYVGTSTGKLQVTTVGGGNAGWADTSSNGLPNKFITDIAVNPTNAAEAYVVVSGFGSGHVFHTTNTGGTWTNVSNNLPDVPTSATAADFRVIPAILYVGTDLGVFRSTDGGTTWENFNNASLPNVVVMDLLLDTTNNKLVAATHGRSAWVTDVSPPIVCNALGAPLSIPDNSPVGVSDTITFTNAAAVTDLNVCVDVSHTFVGDLSVTLKHEETGTTVTVIDRPGYPASADGCSGDNILAILDDEASARVEDQCSTSVPTISGTFTPNNLLSAFDGASLAGHWTLKVTDNAARDTGTLNGWSLIPTSPCPDQDGDGICDSVDPDIDGDGCPNVNEQQTAIGSEFSGGRRDYLNPWDYFNPTHDGQNSVDDILAVIQHYGKNQGDPGYSTNYDRTYLGPNPWNLGPPNGRISVEDILHIIQQYRHDCS